MREYTIYGKDLNMKIDYIQKTARKSLSIIINDRGEVLVKAPKKMSNNDILKFVQCKEDWVNKKVEQIKKHNAVNQDLFNYKCIMFCGKKYNVIKDDNCKTITLTDNDIIIKTALSPKKEIRQLERFLKDKCIEIVGQRIKYFSNLMQLEPSEVKLMNAKRRWGTCDSNQVIAINWRLVMLPPRLIDYVVVHELAHLMEMNHSSAFWAIVSAVLPDVKKLRANLKECSFVLQQFREIPLN